jgi:outer membrane protein OmpA-like peptidoglycan-associated protein
MFESARVSCLLARVSALALVAALASGCSSMSWADPSTWGETTPTDQTPAGDDTSAGASPAGAEGKTVAEANDKFPVLADTPSKAPPTSSTDEQKQVANGLIADRTQAQYSAEALQAGKEPAAAPPPPASAEANIPVPPPSSGDVGQTSAASTAAAPAPSAPPPASSSAPANPPPASTASAAPAPPPPPAASSDAVLGFQPSRAPALDPNVARILSGAPSSSNQRLASLNAAVPNGPVVATIAFAANSVRLDANSVAQVQAAISAYRAKGGQGYVRLIGHASSGAPNLPADKQLAQSFAQSHACADAVARELIKQGVPANRVLIDATSTLAAGEPRRVEIFLPG